jgi:hypothetical protein
MGSVSIDDILMDLNKATNDDLATTYKMVQPNRPISCIDEAYEFLKKWIPELTSEEKCKISDNLDLNKIPDKLKACFKVYLPYEMYFLKYMKPYIHLLTLKKHSPVENNFQGSEYYDPYSENPVISSYVAFMISLIYIMHFPNWKQYLEAISCYSLIYILVDNYIDDIDINHINKGEFISQIYKLMDNPGATGDVIDQRLIHCGDLYNKIITKYPRSKTGFLKSFKREIKGMKLQSKNKSSRKKYYNNCIKKGGYFSCILHYIVSGSKYSDTFDIGSLIQLMDDCTDVINDMKNGHYSIGTYEYIKNGNLDNLWIDMVNRIQLLDSKYTIIKFLFSLTSVWMVATMPYYYSDYLKEKLKSISPFILDDYFISSKMIHDYVIEALKNIK